LKAADARTILQAQLPFVLKLMTDEQIQQMQRVLDAAVVNPGVEKEAGDFYQRAVVRYGSVFTRDETLVHRGDRVMKSFIAVNEADKRIRLDYKVLLTPDALKATTDNPDEAAYLAAVKKTLEATAGGVWLRFAPMLVRDATDRSRQFLDGRTFEVWLSLGPDGDTIPTESGRLTRDMLLKTTVLGAGYYRRVHKGPIQSALEKEIRRLISQIETGSMEHDMEAKRRRDAPVVAKASDVLGGADFPSRSIWDQPHKFVLRAMELNVGGNVTRSPAYLFTAGILTRNAAWLLAQYIEDTNTGAERAVTVLKVAKTAGHIAEVGLGVMGGVGVVRGLVRGGAAIAGDAGAAAVADASTSWVGAAEPLDAAEERMVNQYVAEHGGSPSVGVTKPAGYGRSVSGNVKGGHSAGYGEGFHKF